MNYNIAKKQNIVEVLQEHLSNGSLQRTKEGKIKINNTLPYVGNWMRLSDKTMGKHCFYLWSICYQKFGFVHSQCRNCYKVVANIATLEQMMEVVEVQKKMNVPSKVGIDDRAYTSGQYGAYWYNEGLEEGLEKLEWVRKELEPLGITNVFLKRACTEFENRFGDSAYWDQSPMQEAFEKEMDDLFEWGDFSYENTEWVDNAIFCKWVEFAHSRGDATYLKYTGGIPLYPAYRTYEPGCKHPDEMVAERMAELRKQRDVQAQDKD
jgi:hypothetical protein